MRSNLSSQRRGAFLGLWVGANLLGGFIAGFLEANGLQFMATLILTGAILGALQWPVLRRFGRRFRWWPVASALGWIASTLTLTLIQPLYQSLANALWQQFGLWEVFWLLLVNQPLWVLGMALAQSVVLFGYRSSWIGPWLLASLVGGAASGAVSAAVCAAYCPVLPKELVGIANGAGWAAYGLVTGIVWLMLSDRDGRLNQDREATEV